GAPPGCSPAPPRPAGTARTGPARTGSARARPTGAARAIAGRSRPGELGPREPRRDRGIHRRSPGPGAAADPARLRALPPAGEARELPRLAAHRRDHHLRPDV